MKTEDLQAQGLTQEQIDYVFAESGKEINALKTDRDNYKSQLETTQASLKKFEGVDVDELQNKIKELNGTIATNQENYQKEIADRDFNDLLKDVAKKAGAKDVKAVVPFLDVEKLKASKNQKEDLEVALEEVKKEKDYLFASEKKIPRVVSSTPGTGKNMDDKKAQANQALRSLFGK